MIHLHIEPPYGQLKLEKMLKKAGEVALVHEGMESSDFSLVITGDIKIRNLNKQFRGINKATDVISFPFDPAGEGPRYLGDVVISLPRARAQAKASGHSLRNELQLLTVHGVLHLLGYDHGTQREKAEMWTAQDEILHELGVRITVDDAVATHSKL